MLSLTAALPTFAADDLRCVLKAPARPTAGHPVKLQITLTNRGSAGLYLLKWNTPFEGWFDDYVRVLKDGTEMTYRGPRVKRGDPPKTAYLHLRPGQSRSATVDLGVPFDMSQPGHYRVEPAMTLFDVAMAGQAAIPRSRDQMVSRELACNAVEFEVAAAAPK